jgi:hypothetical protein
MERVIEELSGNEALLQMLDTNAASEMLNWGIATARSVIRRTEDRDGFDLELTILPRLKALRQSMRSIGNWAAGKYENAEDRIELRDRLLLHFRTIFGERREMPTARQMDDLLQQADDKHLTPHQLILRLQDLLEQRG